MLAGICFRISFFVDPIEFHEFARWFVNKKSFHNSLEEKSQTDDSEDDEKEENHLIVRKKDRRKARRAVRSYEEKGIDEIPHEHTTRSLLSKFLVPLMCLCLNSNVKP